MRTSTSILVVLLLIGANINAQTKNGTVYSDHETIEKTKNLWKAFVTGDKDTYMSHYADTVYAFSNGKKNIWTKEFIEKHFNYWQKEYENLDSKDHKPAYPDAIEYNESGMWVQDWHMFTGRHIKTGINLKLHIHHLYSFNKDGKITSIHFYFNNDIFDEIKNSEKTTKNGTVYINHPHILTVRKVMNAFIDKDIEKWASFYTPEAAFIHSSMKFGDSATLEQSKESINNLFFNSNKEYDVEQIGYPDCIYYEKSDSYAVMSWWKMTILKDNKKYEYAFMLNHDFNKDGKIIREYVYGSSNHMEGW